MALVRDRSGPKSISSIDARGVQFLRMALKQRECVCRICTCTLRSIREGPRGDLTQPAIDGHRSPIGGHRVCTLRRLDRCGCGAWAISSFRTGGITQMPEIQNSGSQEADRLSAILAGYLTPKNLAQALGVSERTVARWHRLREGPPRVEIGRKVFYRLESVNTWIASCERPEARADRIRRRPRLRAVEPSRVPVAMQRNDVGPLAGTSGSHD
jgi:predicted DNA-binding transcriptional regulator AlpA